MATLPAFRRSALLLTLTLPLAACTSEEPEGAIDRQIQAATAATVTFKMNGYQGLLDSDLFRIAGNLEQQRAVGVPAGTYGLYAPNTTDLQGVSTNPDPDFPDSPVGSFKVTSGGAVSLLNGASTYFSISGTTITVKTAELTFDPDGNPGLDVGFYAVDAFPFHAADKKGRLMVGRKYRLYSDDSSRSSAGDHFYTGKAELSVAADGSSATIADAEAKKSVTAAAKLVKLQVASITFVKNGYAGNDLGLGDIYWVFGDVSPRVVKNRRYKLYSNDSVDPVTKSHDFSSTYDVLINSSGIVDMGDDSKRSFTFSGSTITARVAWVQIIRNGYAGNLCLQQVQCVYSPDTGNLEVPVLIARDFGVGAELDGTGGPPVRVDEFGNCNVSSVSLGGKTLPVRCGKTKPVPPVPGTPTSLGADVVSKTRVHLHWTPGSMDETGFKVERSLSPTGGFGQIGTSGAGQATYDDTVATGATYYYRVRAAGGSGVDSAYSSVASAVVQAPAAPSLSGESKDARRVDLKWVHGATSGVTFLVERAVGAGNDDFSLLVDNLPATTRTYSDDSAVEGSVNRYRVSAVNVVDVSPSNTVDVPVPVGQLCGAPGYSCPDPTVQSIWNHNLTRISYLDEPSTALEPVDLALPRGLLADPSGGEARILPPTRTCVGSRVDDLRWSFNQESVDFTTGPDGPDSAEGGCRELANRGNKLRPLELVRYHRPRLEHQVSSFGPGVFSNFDLRLTFYDRGIDGHPNAVLFDPETDAPPVTFFDRSEVDDDLSDDGYFHDSETRTYWSLTLYAYDTQWHQVSRAVDATLVYMPLTNAYMYFEPIVLNPANPGHIDARPDSIYDRNGNGFHFVYQFGRDATDEELGYDRSQLWKIAYVEDSVHGQRIDFTYERRPTTGRWLISTATAYLADGTPRVTTYTYSDAGGVADTLVSVKYPDGNSATFSKTFDAATQLWGLTFDDAGAGARSLKKTVWLTGTTFKTPDGKVHGQTPNLVRKVVNGNQEEVVRLQENPNDPNVTFVYEAGRALSRMTTDAQGAPKEVARARTVTTDPGAATYDVLESYQSNELGMITQATDALGKSRSLVRDPWTRDINGVTGRDGSTAQWTREWWSGKPTQQIDRSGRITDFVYDDRDNLIKVTQAQGTAVAATTEYTYSDDVGQVLSQKDPLGRVTDFTYLGGYLASVLEPADVAGGARPTTVFETGSFGLRTAKTDPAGRKTTYQYDARNRLVSTTYADGTKETTTFGTGVLAALPVTETNRLGVTTTYEYDATKRLKKIVRAANKTEKLEETFEYVPGTELVSVATVAGDRTEYTYDQRNRELSRRQYATNGASLVSSRTYDAADRLDTETDPYGRKTFHVYNATGGEVRVVRELVPGGVPTGSAVASLARVTSGNPPYVITDTELDGMQRPLSSTNERGIKYTLGYDQQGRKTELVQAAATAGSRTTRYEYDLAGNVTKTTLPRALRESGLFQTTAAFSGRDRISVRTAAAGTADAASTGLTYSPTGQVLTSTDPRGGVTTNTYDSSDRLLTTKDPGGSLTTYGYDAAGNRTSVKNALNQTSTSTFDGHGRVLTEKNPAGETTTTVYDDNLTDGTGLDSTYATQLAPLGFGAKAKGHASLRTNPAGETQLTVQDGLRRTILRLDGNGNASKTSYDAVSSGLVEVAVTDPLGNVTRSRRDALDRERVSIDALGKQTTRTFDGSGSLLSSRNPVGVGQDCAYDDFAMPTTCTDAQGDATLFERDAAGNLTATVDASGARSTCAFDALDRRTICTDRNGAVSQWSYDKASNVTATTDAESGVTSFTYDARGLKTTATWADSTSATDKQTYAYDALGRMTSKTLQNGNVISYVFDTAGRLTQRTYPDGKNDTYAYDLASRVKTATSGRYGTVVALTYDKGGRTTKDTLTFQSKTYSVSSGYDAGDRLTKLTYPDASIVNRTYNVRNQLASLALGTKAIASYTYDDAGRPTTVNLGNGLVETRAYRPDDTLLSVNTATVGNFSYSYDGTKRKLTEDGTAAAGGKQTFGYDPEGRLIAWSDGSSSQSWALSPTGDWTSTTRGSAVETRTHNAAHELTKVGAAALSYTSRGDIQGDDKGNKLAVDLESRLQTFTRTVGSTTTTINLFYDALGRKAARSVVSGSTTNTTVFVNSGQDTVAEYLNGTFNLGYLVGSGTDDHLGLVKGGKVSFFSRNHLGTVAAVTDEAKAIKERYKYTAYGERTILSPAGAVLSASAVSNQIGFTGRYHDKDTGLLDFRFRQYDPRLGRFTSRDDRFRDGLNLYAASFVPNRTDPSGHAASLGAVSLAPAPALPAMTAILVDPRSSLAGRSSCGVKFQSIVTGGLQKWSGELGPLLPLAPAAPATNNSDKPPSDIKTLRPNECTNTIEPGCVHCKYDDGTVIKTCVKAPRPDCSRSPRHGNRCLEDLSLEELMDVPVGSLYSKKGGGDTPIFCTNSGAPAGCIRCRIDGDIRTFCNGPPPPPPLDPCEGVPDKKRLECLQNAPI